MFTAVGVGEVTAAEAEFAALCASLDPGSVPMGDATAVYESLVRVEKLAAGAKVRMAGRVAAAGEWRRRGHRQPAELLAGLSGTSVGAAVSELATSQRLAELAPTEDALRRGELSASQAAAVADAASADPAR
ncbi:MAG: hypothetical protein GEV08_04860 [Acidimicrobiia bacterium]|nr:hypothetical protein [Acidimicrobiia bacterium]